MCNKQRAFHISSFPPFRHSGPIKHRRRTSRKYFFCVALTCCIFVEICSFLATPLLLTFVLLTRLLLWSSGLSENWLLETYHSGESAPSAARSAYAVISVDILDPGTISFPPTHLCCWFLVSRGTGDWWPAARKLTVQISTIFHLALVVVLMSRASELAIPASCQREDCCWQVTSDIPQLFIWRHTIDLPTPLLPYFVVACRGWRECALVKPSPKTSLRCFVVGSRRKVRFMTLVQLYF